MIKSYGNSHTLSRLSYGHKICVENRILRILTKPVKLSDMPHCAHESKKKKLRIALIASFSTISSKEAPRTRSEIRPLSPFNHKTPHNTGCNSTAHSGSAEFSKFSYSRSSGLSRCSISRGIYYHESGQRLRNIREAHVGIPLLLHDIRTVSD